MAFERFEYTKSWEDAAAFPAYEPDEKQVRADLQCLHDEARDGINRLIDALNDASAAAQLPFAPVEGMSAKTVQEAVEEVFASVTDAVAGQITNGSVKKEKLEAALLKRIYGGRVWTSLNDPAVTDNPGRDFPVGQLWLRPAMTLENLASDSWTVEGGSIEARDGGWVFTTDGSQDYFKATQSAVNGGLPGQRVLIRLCLGELSSHLEEVTLHLNGLETELEEDGIYETVLDASGKLEILLLGQWPFAEEAQIMEVTALSVFNPDAVEAQFPDYEPREDWSDCLALLEGASNRVLPMAVWLQTTPGQWQQIAYETLPVSRGGTGLTAAAAGALLCGTGTQALAALSPVEQGILQCNGKNPGWVAPAELAQACGYLRTETGEYEGTATFEDRTITLPVTPKLLFIWSGDVADTTCIANGGKSSGSYFYSHNGGQIAYKAWVSLSENTLTFSNDQYSGQESKMFSQHMNAAGVTYNWLAIF